MTEIIAILVGLLSLAFFVCAIISLINPKLVKFDSRLKGFSTYAVAWIAFSVIFSALEEDNLENNITEQDVSEKEDSVVVQYARQTVNVRSGPDTDHDIIDQLTTGNRVEIREKTSGWARIGDGEWVHANLLQDKPIPPIEIVDTEWGMVDDSNFFDVTYKNNTDDLVLVVHFQIYTYDREGEQVWAGRFEVTEPRLGAGSSFSRGFFGDDRRPHEVDHEVRVVGFGNEHGETFTLPPYGHDEPMK